MTCLKARRRALYAAIAEVNRRDGASSRRAEVFAFLAEQLDEGPAPVPFVVIKVATGLHGKAVDACLDALVRDGWLVIAREGVPGAGGAPGTCRLWDVGPRVHQQPVLSAPGSRL